MSAEGHEKARRFLQRPLTLHPLLFASFPIVFLYAANLSEGVALREALIPLAIAVGAAMVLLALFTLAFRSAHKAGVAVSILAILFFTYGRVFSAVHGLHVAGIALDRHRNLLVVWAALAIGGVILASRLGRNLPGATRVLNVVAGVLVLINVVQIGSFELSNHGKPPIFPDSLGSGATNNPLGHRDIYYIVLEEYGNRQTLQDMFGYDNGPFLDFLRRKGFYVSEESTANYPRTSLSLASSLSMRYLDFLTAQYGTATAHVEPLDVLMQRSQVARFLKSIGYGYIHIGSYWDGTATSPIADVNAKFPGLSEFNRTLVDSTVLRATGPLDFRKEQWGRVQFQFNALEEARKVKGPTYVFGHILLMHEPYVFDQEGNYVKIEQADERPREVNYANQLKWANGRLEDLVNELLSGPPATRPIIVLQADEGPYEGRPIAWTRSPEREALERKFGILSAYYLPGLNDTGLYQTITPVNSFRLIFDRYFQARLALLPDKNYVFRDLHHLYDFTEVTSEL
jgi:hypothetical protein